MPLRIQIADDSPAIRRLLRFFIEHNTDWQVCGEADNGQIAVEKVAKLKPHAVILDLSMPVMNGLEAAREITRIAPNVQMVMFTMHTTDQLLKDAQAAGKHRSEEHTSELQSPDHLVCRLLLEKKKTQQKNSKKPAWIASRSVIAQPKPQVCVGAWWRLRRRRVMRQIPERETRYVRTSEC